MDRLEHLIDEIEMSGIALEVLDASGAVVHPRDKKKARDEDFSSLIWQGEVAVSARRFYCRVGKATLSFPRSEQIGAMGAIIRAISGFGQEREGEISREALMLRILNMGYEPSEMAPLLARAQIDADAERCVLTFQTRDDNAALLRALGELFDEHSPDIVLTRGAGVVTLIKNMKGLSYEELTELALAVADTVHNEAGTQVHVGIGDPRKSIAHLPESYQEALTALEIGRVYLPEKTVLLYRRLIVERFLQEIPEEITQRYHQLMFGRRNVRLLNEEMIATIDKFFACSLNLSEAARQLYIHRNTLVYRLDKFQKATGLDLRVFDDAVTFKLLRMMGSVHGRRVGIK